MAYFDHAATTPMSAPAVAAMTKALSTVGNAASLHASGRAARRIVEEAREGIADALGAHSSEVIFTAGGTESDNLAVKGIYWARNRPRVLVSAVEHHAVLDAAEWLEKQGAKVTWLPVDIEGRVLPETLSKAIAVNPGDVALITVMWANNEVGTINPIHDLASIAAEHDIPFHTDAVQAVGAVPVNFTASGVSALALTGHKLGGPLGTGALLLKRNVPCTPVLHGGGQEREIRSGTLNLPGIVGLAAAVRTAVDKQQETAARLTLLRNELIDAVRNTVPDAILNGGETRLPGNAHFTFPGCVSDSLLMLLDANGIECSSGSACTAGVTQASHVLLAMGIDPVTAKSALRFSLGHTSTAAEVAELAAIIGPVVERARNAGL